MSQFVSVFAFQDFVALANLLMTQITDRLQYLNELESRGRPGWKTAAFFLDRSPK